MSIRSVSPLKPSQRSLAMGFLLAAGGAAFAAQGGCSAITNTTAVQCTSEAECLSLGPDFANTTCDATTKTCKKVEAPVECSTNAECGAKKQGSICRKSDHKCVDVTSKECQRVLGDPKLLLDDKTMLIGLQTPAGSAELGDAFERSAELAQLDFCPQTGGTGLPSAVNCLSSRPFVIVACHEFNSNGFDGLVAAENHLVKDLEIPIIIGPVDPTNAQVAMTQVALPNKVLSLMPGAITSNMNTLPNPIAPTPLIWRLNWSDIEASDTIQAFVQKQLLPRMKIDGTVAAGEDLRIAIIQEGDYKGTTVANTIKSKLTWNTQDDGTTPANCLQNLNKNPSACIPGDFGSLNDTLGNPSPEGKINNVIGATLLNNGSFAPPHVIIHSYATFGITRILFPTEGAFESVGGGALVGKHRPYHIGVYPPFNTFTPMFGFMDGQSKAQEAAGYIPFRQRMFGFYAHNTVPQDQIDNFVQHFKDHFQEFANSGTPGDVLVRLYYDAVYMAVAAITANGDKPLTGPNLAGTLGKLTLGEPVQIDTSGPTITHILDLAGKGGVNIEGLSGSLDLSDKTGAAKYSVEVSCPGQTPKGGSTNFVPSGFYYDQAASTALGKVWEADGSPVVVNGKQVCPLLKK